MRSRPPAPRPLSVRGHTFDWGDRTFIMGVINLAPDSFSDGGEVATPEAALERAVRFVEDGVDLLDIGGESTRPFSQPVSVSVEMDRVVPVVELIRREIDVPISIDTTKASVADAALSAGADMVNDVSAMRFDRRMLDVVRGTGAPVILMHMKGTPSDMQRSPVYEDVVREVRDFLQERAAWAEGMGIPRERILVDPGIGFGKRLEDNLALIDRLDAIAGLGYPVLIGPSRKAFIGAVTGIKEPSRRDVPTLGAVAAAALRGANMVRVHEVRQTGLVLKVVDAIRRAGRVD